MDFTDYFTVKPANNLQQSFMTPPHLKRAAIHYLAK